MRTAVGYGGFVWVNVDDGAPSLGDWIGPALETLEPFLRQPLEVFHYQKVVVQTNYKLWHDTNSEFYHDYMHYFNRVTGMQQPGYFQRRYTPYPNGHAAVGSMEVRDDRYEGSGRATSAGPGSRRAAGSWSTSSRASPTTCARRSSASTPRSRWRRTR